MSNLVVVGFPKVEEAEEVRRELVTIQQEHLITLEDAVVQYKIALRNESMLQEHDTHLIRIHM